MNATRRFASAAGLLALTLSTLAVAPVAAAGTSPDESAGRPDASIRFRAYQSPFGTYPDRSPWAGEDVYNTTGWRQTRMLRAAGAYERGTHLVFTIAIQNDGHADRFGVTVTGSGAWSVRYFAGTTDITRAVESGMYRTETLGRGDRAFIKVKVRLGRAGTSVIRRVTFTSARDGERQDAVRLRASYSACSC